MIAVAGRNGTGKSTLLRTLAGLQKQLDGKILIQGKETVSMSRNSLAKIAGYISTEVIRVSQMRVIDLVALGRYPHTGWTGRIDRKSIEAIEDALHKTGLSNLSTRFLSQLSDGERQRVMIARVLAQDTAILIMDEPLAFLDLPSKYEISNLLRKLASSGKLVIYSTHDLSIASRLADRFWLIADGKLLEGSPVQMINSGAFATLFGDTMTFETFRRDFAGTI
jgi:iron complex transport system ATP-binding protein